MKRIIRVRKEQQCRICDKPIPRGSKAILEKQYAYLSNQFLGTYYYHEECDAKEVTNGIYSG